ncbi:peptidoglycan recognition protein family protein [Chengkuizengella marina]|uniref:N-acetylmuramoyl-L-alanine amidase n=1 Tax=Chengkuizengella marina TaxID=2507566 RepID=A0A6N9Q6C9_9BACL|nr:peptidoglycan recognition family protein [Chengkuizengella marina]NBI30261.1 N-acetylmuramoyl-L-alanine amidase [Chengkuizengella marina]
MSFKIKYPITKKYLTTGTKRRSGIMLAKLEFIVAHDTGNDGSTALQNINYYENSKNTISASAHIFVDDKGIYECIPLLTGPPEKAWHVQYQKPIDNELFGDDANDIAAGVELCYSNNHGNINNEDAYKRYVWVLAYLCYKFGLDPAKKIIGHHILDPKRKTDPQNAFLKMEKSYEQFLQDVVIEYFECLSKQETLMKLEGWKLQVALDSLNNLSKKGLLSNVEKWKEKVIECPEQIIKEMPWLFFVMLDRISQNIRKE